MPPESTVTTFPAQLPPERRKELSLVRAVIQRSPSGYQEALRGQMIVYEVPLDKYPDTYNGHPLWLAALAAPKRSTHCGLQDILSGAS